MTHPDMTPYELSLSIERNTLSSHDVRVVQLACCIERARETSRGECPELITDGDVEGPQNEIYWFTREKCVEIALAERIRIGYLIFVFQNVVVQIFVLFQYSSFRLWSCSGAHLQMFYFIFF